MLCFVDCSDIAYDVMMALFMNCFIAKSTPNFIVMSTPNFIVMSTPNFIAMSTPKK